MHPSRPHRTAARCGRTVSLDSTAAYPRRKRDGLSMSTQQRTSASGTGCPALITEIDRLDYRQLRERRDENAAAIPDHVASDAAPKRLAAAARTWPSQFVAVPFTHVSVPSPPSSVLTSPGSTSGPPSR